MKPRAEELGSILFLTPVEASIPEFMYRHMCCLNTWYLSTCLSLASSLQSVDFSTFMQGQVWDSLPLEKPIFSLEDIIPSTSVSFVCLFLGHTWQYSEVTPDWVRGQYGLLGIKPESALPLCYCSSSSFCFFSFLFFY